MTTRPVRQWNGLTVPDAGTYTLDEAHRRVGFVGQHMMVSPIRGEFTSASATIEVAEDPLASRVTASIDAASIMTQNGDRDVHLRSADFLDVETYPTLDFRSTSVTWQGGEQDSILAWARLRNRSPERATVPAERVQAAAAPSGRFLVAGLLTIRDVTRPIDLTMQFGGASRDPYGRDIFGFHATGQFDREDYGLVWNVLLETGGFLVGKKVSLEIAGEAIHQA
ncbi:YceI family protein [Cellulomonas sp. PhB143]|uniref:YceI family protein n=1 Tax=Cellulomonas sp. PhB143 TaxID=2485186 RepID=UPI000F45F3CB|nr:YceI family protein [Cellulomonas sp. PhB143]ROS77251.1 polyisoprenoid-binding protein YceI [Cellulomonas sp. PhB143]